MYKVKLLTAIYSANVLNLPGLLPLSTADSTGSTAIVLNVDFNGLINCIQKFKIIY